MTADILFHGANAGRHALLLKIFSSPHQYEAIHVFVMTV